jgi:hypothetical protein
MIQPILDKEDSQKYREYMKNYMKCKRLGLTGINTDGTKRINKNLVRASEKMADLNSEIGGAGGIRTRYLLNANQAFSRVNYGPMQYISNLSKLGLYRKLV